MTPLIKIFIVLFVSLALAHGQDSPTVEETIIWLNSKKIFGGEIHPVEGRRDYNYSFQLKDFGVLAVTTSVTWHDCPGWLNMKNITENTDIILSQIQDIQIVAMNKDRSVYAKKPLSPSVLLIACEESSSMRLESPQFKRPVIVSSSEILCSNVEAERVRAALMFLKKNAINNEPF